MDPVHDEMEQLAQASLRFVMECVPMDYILEKCPDQDAEHKEHCYRENRQLLLRKCQVKHQADDRAVEQNRGSWMDVRKELHEVTFKHPHRFVLIGNEEPAH